MLRTIKPGPYSLIQGHLVSQMDDGRISVRVGDTIFVGMPVVPTPTQSPRAG